MTSQRGGSRTNDPMQAGAQMWESGYQSLFEGWRQAQDFWNNAARSWGEVAGSWLNQLPQQGGGMNADAMSVVRELQEASMEVAQAWMRLPMMFAGGMRPDDLQASIQRLTEAQGRAYQLWLESLNRLTGGSMDTLMTNMRSVADAASDTARAAADTAAAAAKGAARTARAAADGADDAGGRGGR